MTENQNNTQRSVPDFTKYPREFITYKWFRPLVTGILFAIIYMIFGSGLVLAVTLFHGGEYVADLESIVAGGYDTFNTYSGPGALATLGIIALMIPALAIANKLAGRRTFKSYASSRGGWNFGIFFRCMLLFLVICAIPVFVFQLVVYGKVGGNQFTLIGLILCTILGPMQCIAEEYLFRSFLMQTFGSWFKIPVLAIVLQTLIFAAMHPYNMIGVAEIVCSGVTMGLIAWLAHGIEASSALHICNNMTLFYATGVGISQISSQTTLLDLGFAILLDVVYILAILFFRKRGMFDVRKADDAAAYNAKVKTRLAKKAAKEIRRS